MARFPITRLRFRTGLPAPAAFVVAVLIGLGACMSELPGPGTLSAVGVIEGRVLEAGAPVPVMLRFRSLLPEDVRISAEARADSNGWYRAELPLGLYETTISFDGEYGADSDVDTVTIGRAVRRKDFERGRARVTVTLPSAFEGQDARLRLSRPFIQADQSGQVTDGVATFDLRLLPPAAYTMRLTAGNGRGDVYLPGTYLAAEADSLRVGTAEVEHACDLRFAYISVSGRVTGSWQLEELTMEVSAVTPYGMWRTTTVCEPDGTFRLDMLAPERVRLVTRCESIEQWFGGTSLQNATAYDLHSGDHLTGLELAGGGLRVRFEGPGVIADNLGGLTVVYPDGRQHERSYLYRQPAFIPNLPAGAYRLFIPGFCNGDPWLPEWYDGAEAEAGAQTLEVVNGSWTDVTVTHEAGGTLIGELVEAGGDEGHLWFLEFQDQTGAPICSTSVGMSGGFVIAGLPDGDYYLMTKDEYHDDWWYPGTPDFAQATRLTITGAGSVTGLVWTVPDTEVLIFP